jgi:hypothetical protein
MKVIKKFCHPSRARKLQTFFDKELDKTISYEEDSEDMNSNEE